MTSAVNSYLHEYLLHMPDRSKQVLAPETMECEGRRSLLLNHVVNRPIERMALFQLCLNEENRRVTPMRNAHVHKDRRRESCAIRSACYYAIPKVHVTSKVLLKRQSRERLVDARIVERVQFTQPRPRAAEPYSTTNSNRHVDTRRRKQVTGQIAQHLDQTYILPPFDDSFLTPAQLNYCKNASFETEN